MSGASTLDWAWYLAAALVAACGLPLLIWAWFWDRSRGRKRCPKCWYDMTEAPSPTCSECGYTAKRPKKLLRTRRRWRPASIALLLLAGSIACAVTPAIQQGRAPSLVPTTALILMMPHLPDWSQTLHRELDVRLRMGKVADWQVAWLWRRCFDPEKSRTFEAFSRQKWATDVDAQCVVTFSPSNLSWFWPDTASLRLLAKPRTEASQTMVVVPPQTRRTHFKPNQPKGLGDLPRWRERLQSLGRLPAGEHTVTIDLIVEHRDVKIWRGEAVVQLEVEGTLVEMMEPVSASAADEIIRTSLWVAVYERSMRVVRAFPKIDELGDGAALGLVFELLHDGSPIARTRGWWGNNSVRRESEPLRWEWGRFDADTMRRDTTGTWTLRVRGDPELAMLAFDDQPAAAPDTHRYWSGEVEIPLQMSEPGFYAIPTRTLVPRRVWERSWDRQTRRWQGPGQRRTLSPGVGIGLGRNAPLSPL